MIRIAGVLLSVAFSMSIVTGCSMPGKGSAGSAESNSADAADDGTKESDDDADDGTKESDDDADGDGDKESSDDMEGSEAEALDGSETEAGDGKDDAEGSSDVGEDSDDGSLEGDSKSDKKLVFGKNADGDEDKDKSGKEGAEELINGLPEWKWDYMDYLDALGEEYVKEVHLLNIDDDGIPELYINGQYSAAGAKLVTWKRGRIQEEFLASGGYSYIPEGNRFLYSSGHSDEYDDVLYELTNTNFRVVEEGTYGAYDNSHVEYDKNGDPIYDYFWNDKAVTRNDYDKMLEGCIDLDKAERVPEIFGRASAVKKCIREYEPSDRKVTKGHRYEFIVDDVTWDEAYEACRKKGGYLARIETEEEYKDICDRIEKEGLEKKIFWVGAGRVDGIYMYGWCNDDGTFTTKGLSTYRSKHWLYGEPTFYSETASGDYMDEMVVNFFYHKGSKGFVYNDAPSDILAAAPDYKGRVAYICEFDD